jgi:hypothetical protein
MFSPETWGCRHGIPIFLVPFRCGNKTAVTPEGLVKKSARCAVSFCPRIPEFLSCVSFAMTPLMMLALTFVGGFAGGYRLRSGMSVRRRRRSLRGRA